MITKETLITWYDSREEQPKDGEAIFICAVTNEHGNRVLKASGIYKADDNMLHIVKLSKYPYYMWCRLGDISPWK